MEEQKKNAPQSASDNSGATSLKIKFGKESSSSTSAPQKTASENSASSGFSSFESNSATPESHKPAPRPVAKSNPEPVKATTSHLAPSTAKPTNNTKDVKPAPQAKAAKSTKLKKINLSRRSKKTVTPTDISTSATAARTTTATKAKHDNIVYICCAVFAICAVALITWGIVSMMNKGISEDTTFASNDTQTTITIEPTESDHSSISHTRTVYEYDGDNVVGMKTYFEYADNEAAKTAYEQIKDQPEFKGAEVIDKYIVVTADPNSFKGLTADDIRQQAEAIKQFQDSQKKSQPSDDQPNDESPEESAEEGPSEPEE